MNKSALLIGSFILAAFGLAVGAILWLSGNSLFDTQVRAVIYFKEGVAGLYVGAPVTFRGVAVGQVDSIGLQVNEQTLTARIPVTIRLSTGIVTFENAPTTDRAFDVPALVQRGLRARLVSQSVVTGQKSIDLNLIADAAPVAVVQGKVPEIPVLADRFGVLVDQLAEVPLREIIQELRSTMAAFKTTLDTAGSTLVALKTTLDTAGSTLAAAGVVVGGAGRELASVGEQARRTLTMAGNAVTQVQQSSDTALLAVTRLADTGNSTVSALQPELVRTLSEARLAAESARLAMARLAELSAPDAPLRSDLDSAVADLAQAARGLRDWSELVQEHPNALLFGRRRP